MRFFDISFFCEDGKSPKIHFNKTEDPYPFTIRINSSDKFYRNPSITIHLESESEFTNFCNSFLNEFKTFTKGGPE